MADKKISALTAASTPLAGTEVLPIVQSGATVKVANNDLRPKQIQSNATSGVLQVVGPAAASTRVMTTPDANFTAARTDAAQSFAGDQTLSTGNLVIGTAGKGVDFSADPSAAGMTSELLDDYEEGTWTPTLISNTGTITSYTSSGRYTKIGRFILAQIRIDITNNGTGAGTLRVGSFPFSAPNALALTGATREDTVVGFGIVGSGQSTTEMVLTKTDGTYPGGTNYGFTLSVSYSV
jgi:hypothetical protein